jgi:M6 family metalloprotease-like protein
LFSLVPNTSVAQDLRHPRWEIKGFDFRKDGVWRTQARAVRARRAELRAAGRFAELNAPVARVAPMSQVAGPQPSATVVSGVLKVPAILFRYKDSPAPTFVAADYDAVLFGATPAGAAAGRPYTYRSFYSQLSNGVFDIQGQTFGYANLDSNEVYYVGGTSSTCATQNPFGSSNCNGLFSSLAISRMQEALTKALGKLDAQIDFSQYADTSGFVPLVLFMHEAMGGECGPSSAPQNHLWAHRFSLPTYTTNDNDPFHAGQKVKISDYVLQPGVGGSSSCTTSQIMPIGTVAHETGHGFGLPDLYDTQGPTEGIGQWGLMSSGSFTSPLSPARMEAWSLNQLGWIKEAPLTANGTYSFDAAPLSDTAYYVAVQGANPRTEYFLLENRQRQQSDSALIRIHCQRAGNPIGCGGGLLIWHVDQVKMSSSGNAVNSGPIHGLELMQADAFRNLDASASGNSCPQTSMFLGCSNRGDAGDPYPGTTGNTAFVFRTNPASLKNVDGSFAGIAVDSIQQLVTDRTMSFRLRFGALTVVRASDTAATITFDGTPFNVFRDLLEQGSSHTVGFATGQVSGDGRTRWYFASWSDGGAISHPITGTLAGGTLTANLGRQFKLIATPTSGGSITADTAINLAGDFVPDGRAVKLTPVDGGARFCGWTGDSTTTDSVITLPMQRPYTVTANFGTTAAITSANARPNGVMGATYADTLRISGGGGLTTWSVTGGALPQGVTLSASGVMSGFPQQSGNFTYTATVTSCSTSSRTFTLSVGVPTLATADVIAQLLGPTSPLNADQIRYLDYLGNNNGSFDIGDFLAWVKATGAPLSAAALQALQRKGGPR